MRYTDEVQFRFIGSRAECIKYIPEARKLLGVTNNQSLENGIVDTAFRRVTLPDGAVIEVTARAGPPLVTINVSRVSSRARSRLVMDMFFVWKPEGICLTPVSEEHPDGYGLPTRNYLTGERVTNELGTEAGVWPQVIINKYENNKYLDKREFISGLDAEILDTIVQENPQLRFGWSTPFVTEGFSIVQHSGARYNPRTSPYDVEGVDDGLLYWSLPENQQRYQQTPGVFLEGIQIFKQFTGYLHDDLIYENESDTWHTHRPEEVLYFTPGQEGVFQYTNTLRTNLGLGRFHRVVRGHPNIANYSVNEVALSGKQFHDNEDFRFGYRDIDQRARVGIGRPLIVGENLLITNATPATFGEGEAAAMLWEDSPVHYANMTDANYTELEDAPGAEHFVGATVATVTETESMGVLPEPYSGYEWAQLFSVFQSWVPTPFQYHEGSLGVGGSYGLINHHGRDNYYGVDYLFVSYAGSLYAIPNDLFTTNALGVFGCAAYLDPADDQLKLRAVVCTSDYILDPTPNLQDIEDFTLYVVTLPVNVTPEDADWYVEDSITYGIADDWMPAMQGGVKFSPDGSRFVYTMHKMVVSHTTALDYGAVDFTAERSALLNPRYYLQVVHVEYHNETFTNYAQVHPMATVDCGTTGEEGEIGHRTHYERALSGSLRLYPDYDADNELIYATLFVEEASAQEWIDEGFDPGAVRSTDNWCYRVRYLEFPSGKRVYTMQQYMRNYESIASVVDITAESWPAGDGTGDNYWVMLHYINVRDEDVVYTKRGAHHDLYYPDGDTYSKYFEHGPIDIIFDGGPAGMDREVATLFHEDDKYFTDNDGLVPAHADIVLGEGYYGLRLLDSSGVYQMDITPCCRFYTLNIMSVEYDVRPMISTPAPYVGCNVDAEATPAIFDFPAYNGHAAWAVDHVIGRPPVGDYFVSANLGVDQRHPSGFLSVSPTTGSSLNWGSSALMGKSFMVCNIAPIMVSEDVARCQVVRYKERVVLRLEHFLWPWPAEGDIVLTGDTAPGQRTPVIEAGSDVSEFAGDWSELPEGTELIVWANFDIDAEVGISDVVDIAPFGRV